MRFRVRPAAAVDAGVAVAMLAVLYLWALRSHFLADFMFEAQPAVEHLRAGDLHGFLALAPVYSGSLVLRAPVMALAPDITMAYRLGAVECVLAACALGLALAHRVRISGQRGGVAWIVIALCIANPVAALALKMGHPEEILAASLAVAGVMLATRDRSVAAGLLLGVAIASKQWAVIAVPIALAAAPRRQVRLGLAAVAAAALVLAPVVAVNASHFVIANRSAATLANGFTNLGNIWWLLGAYHHTPADLHSLLFAPVPSAFAAHASRPLIIALPMLLALAWWRRRARCSTPDDVLLLLAAAGLLRCVLDPWNIVYYHLPFLFALLAWEVRRRPGLPFLSIAATGLVWVTFERVATFASKDATTVFYIAWALPVIAALVLGALRPAPVVRFVASWRGRQPKRPRPKARRRPAALS